MTERERLLWAAIRRALMMIVSAIDTYIIGKNSPDRSGR